MFSYSRTAAILLGLCVSSASWAGGDLRNASCWYDREGKLMHSKIYVDEAGIYRQISCPATATPIVGQPALRTHTREEWAQMLINKGRGPDFQEYARENDREKDSGGNNSWWADTYGQRQARDAMDAANDRAEIENKIGETFNRQLGHPGGLGEWSGDDSITIRER